MDIVAVGNNNYKIKGKSASVGVSSDKIIIEQVGKAAFTISEPGEYEVGGVSVLSFGSQTNVVEIDNLRIVFLGTEKPSDETISEAGSIDIAVSVSIDIAKAVDPWIAVTTTEIAGVEALPKLSTTADKLPTDLQVVVLSTK
ncbi:MAG: hypothetical protein AAB909_00345 [Patescibacteria group bacterium]